jgi:hypothetical protein
VRRIVGESRLRKKVQLTFVRNYCPDAKDQQQSEPSVFNKLVGGHFRKVQSIFGDCGPGPLTTNFVTSWKQVMEKERLAPAEDWFERMCVRNRMSKAVSNASMLMQKDTSSKYIKNITHIRTPYLLQRTHFLVCARVMMKYIEDTPDVDVLVLNAAVGELLYLTDRNWAKLEFELCSSVGWQLRQFVSVGLEVGYSHHKACNTEGAFWCACETPRRMSDVEDDIALKLALHESLSTDNGGGEASGCGGQSLSRTKVLQLHQLIPSFTDNGCSTMYFSPDKNDPIDPRKMLCSPSAKWREKADSPPQIPRYSQPGQEQFSEPSSRSGSSSSIRNVRRVLDLMLQTLQPGQLGGNPSVPLSPL